MVSDFTSQMLLEVSVAAFHGPVHSHHTCTESPPQKRADNTHRNPQILLENSRASQIKNLQHVLKMLSFLPKLLLKKHITGYLSMQIF